MSDLFDINSKFFAFLIRILDLVILNILFILCCLPIITIGASFTALYTITLRMIRNEDNYIVKDFCKSFKENFYQSTVIWIIALSFIIMFYLSLRALPLVSNILILSLFIIGFFTFSCVVSYVFPITARFYNNIITILKNSLLMAFSNIPLTIPIVILNTLPIICLTIDMRVFAAYASIATIIGFSLTAFINSYILEFIFKKYIPAQ